MRKTLAWLLASLAGFGLMFLSYWQYIRVAQPNMWTNGFLFVGSGEPAASVTVTPVIHAQMVYAAPTLREQIYNGVVEPGSAESQFRPPREKLFLLDAAINERLSPDMLARGRLPRAGANEMLAGCETQTQEFLKMGDQRLDVVGVLDRSVTVFAHSYLLAEGSPASAFFRPPYEQAMQVYLVPAAPAALRDPAVLAELAQAFPEGRFERQVGDERRLPVSAGAFGLYTLGMMLFIAGGVGLLWRAYGWLAGRVRLRLLAAPLDAIGAWPRTWWILHGVFFGVFFMGTLMAFLLPEFQDWAWQYVGRRTRDDSLYGVAMGAYQTRNVLLAAALTLANNFLKSFGVLTASSFVLPGLGLMLWQATMMLAGMACAPINPQWAMAMLPHSLVLLLEMEGYILATFFAVLIPVYVFRKSEGPTWWRRYGRAVLLNLKANVIVLAVLLIAAAYEAIEIIFQLPVP